MSYISNPSGGESFSDVKYWGDPDTDGSWRIIKVGDYLEVQKRVGGVWTNAFTFELA